MKAYNDWTRSWNVRVATEEDLNHEARRATNLSDTQMDEIEANIELFCDLYRATLQQTQATPKLHILEAHFVEFMREWRALGLIGEDAIESLHAKLNEIYRRVHGIRNRIKKQMAAWGLLDAAQLGGAIARAEASRQASKRKFTDSSSKRAAKRRKKKATKEEATRAEKTAKAAASGACESDDDASGAGESDDDASDGDATAVDPT
jgi:hypothetical protein